MGGVVIFMHTLFFSVLSFSIALLLLFAAVLQVILRCVLSKTRHGPAAGGQENDARQTPYSIFLLSR